MVNYQKRQQVARVVSIFGFLALVIFTKCSSLDDGAGDLEQNIPDDISSMPLSLRYSPVADDEDKEEMDAKNHYYLLLGSDSDDLSKARTDTIMIAVLDYTNLRMGIVSIPRDLWVDIPGMGKGRINKVVRVANRFLGPGSGTAVLKQIIERDFGFELDGTVQINLAGFENLVDRVGGVEVNVVCPIKDNFVSASAKGGFETLDLDPGMQLLNGHQALLFARSRHGRTDMDRSRRQQALVLGLQRQLLGVSTVPRIAALWGLMSKHVSTDVGLKDVFRIAQFASRLNPKDIHGLVLKKPVVEELITSDGKQVVELKRDELKEALGNLFETKRPGYIGKQHCRPKDAGIQKNYGSV